MVEEFINKILTLIYPSKCILCGRILDNDEKYMCRHCTDANPAANIIRFAEHGQYWNKAAAPFYYTGQIKQAIRKYKFSCLPGYAAAFAYFMLPPIYENGFDSADYVAFVPGKGGLARSRGYNQAELLARELYKQSGGKLKKPARLIKKVRKTKHQYRVSGEERARNIDGAFKMAKNIDLSGCKVLLVDDILTTGATASECAKCMLMNGAREVNVITAAVGKYFKDGKNNI